MHWTVERDPGRVAGIELNGIGYTCEADRYLVVRWANGVGTIEVDCPSVGSARRECRRIQEVQVPKRPVSIDLETRQDAARDRVGDGDQLSLLVD